MREQIYLHILRIGLVPLKNQAGRAWYRRLFDKSELSVAELLRLIPPLLLAKGPRKGDVYILEAGVKSFLETYPEKDSVSFVEIIELCAELKELVEQNLPGRFDVPDEIKVSIRRFRYERDTNAAK